MGRKTRSRSHRSSTVPSEAHRAGAATPATEPLFPPGFRARIEELLGAESEAFFAALEVPPSGLRVNTLRIAPERFRRISPFRLLRLPHPEEGFLVAEGERPGKHPYHAAGLYYLQDPGAMAVAALLDPRPGERVIDLAAAPGGKTTHLAARMQGEGLLVANDVHPARTRELIGNLERCGVRNALVTLESVERLADHFGAWFDRVLLDAPCSGEAMFHKSWAAREAWSPAAVAGCARRQRDLLRDAARLVRPGGVLLYSTCTFSPEEDEEVVARFLPDAPAFEIMHLPPVPGAEPGRPDWLPEALRDPSLRRTVRLWPHRVPGAGHFVAALRRAAGEGNTLPPYPAGAIPPAARQRWAEFHRDRLADGGSGGGALELRGQELYRLPEGTPELGRLRVERPGWWLGTVAKNRFEPAHALALGLLPAEVRTTVELGAEDPEVLAYLRGETLSVPGDPGWVAVAVDGFSLGWGKRVGGTVKNHYPKGLRWMG